jgi:hypothetical protein
MAAFLPDTAAQLAAIEASLVNERRMYRVALDACHEGEARYHEAEVDRLIGLWDTTRQAATTEAT